MDLALYLKPTACTCILYNCIRSVSRDNAHLSIVPHKTDTSVCRTETPKIIAWSFLLLPEVNRVESEGRGSEASVHIFREDCHDVFCKAGT